MRHILRFLLLVLPLPVSAGEWALRATDRPFTPQELAALPGQSFVFFDDGESIYGPDGAYSYTFSAKNGGGTSWGSYRLAEDGSICVDFVSGATRCDFLVHSGARIVVLTEDGERYPVR